jgi:hypothetical protein
MRLPLFLQRRLTAWAFDVAVSREPDRIIGEKHAPYMHRWYVTPWSSFDRHSVPTSIWDALRRQLPNIYVHRFFRSDEDRALHDHPWANMSIVLFGSYAEHTIRAGGISDRHIRSTGSIVMRRARAAHRVELIDTRKPVLTLFVTGPKIRDWGFHCPHGWRRWQDFTATKDGASVIGRGCE